MGPHEARHAAAPAAAFRQHYGETWPPYDQPYQHRPPVTRRRKRRVFLWIFLAVQALFVIWLVTGLAAAGGGVHASAVAYCHAHPSLYVSYQDCLNLNSAGGKAGTAIGAGVIVLLWMVVDVILGISYGVYRLARR